MPITELDKTAVAASEALGMNVTVYPEEADAIGIAGLPDQSPALYLPSTKKSSYTLRV